MGDVTISRSDNNSNNNNERNVEMIKLLQSIVLKPISLHFIFLVAVVDKYKISSNF